MKSILILAVVFFHFSLSAENVQDAGAKGRRKIPEGYILSPQITKNDLSEVKEQGAHVIVSLVDTPQLSVTDAKQFGIKQLKLPMGNSFTDEHIHALLDLGKRSDVLIHCRHGADRTGAVAAFRLAVFEGWSIADALAAVVYPDRSNIAGLKRILKEEGIRDGTFTIAQGSGKTGVYAPYGPRGGGGHKTTGNYGKLTRSTIHAIIKAREMLNQGYVNSFTPDDATLTDI